MTTTMVLRPSGATSFRLSRSHGSRHGLQISRRSAAGIPLPLKLLIKVYPGIHNREYSFSN